MGHMDAKKTMGCGRWIRLHADDDVVVVRCRLRRGECIDFGGEEVELGADVLPGHKMAVRPVSIGGYVRKYGQVIGVATVDIRRGDWVHSHNLGLGDGLGRGVGDDVMVGGWDSGGVAEGLRFLGYDRGVRGVGTRNYIGVLTTVNCSASAARLVRERFSDREVRSRYPGVDGVVAMTFKGGCGMAGGEPQRLLGRVLNGMLGHPNFGGVVLLGLGCEMTNLGLLREAGGWVEGEDLVSLEIQGVGGLRRTVERAVLEVERMLPRVAALRRTEQALSGLKLALNCGGSDGYSGVTANPALGWAADELVRAGGVAVLGETPEIYGAEHLLLRRAVSEEVAERLRGRIRWWEEYVARHGATIDNNPSPGNKAGGLTTIWEKSLGAVAKGGTAPLVAVHEYAEQVRGPGLCFMDTPGLDPVSMTGLVSGGCNVGVFTTGRGSVYGCKPAPCLKVASHSGLYEHMSEDMDINAGTILDGGESVEEVGRRIFEAVISMASGERTKSELAGVGEEEFAPWILGPTL
ncbi:MAG: hypothetical protein RI897_1897 [Verrucomicrobiota bacterium]